MDKRQTLTSRERIQRAIRHQETDRVPIDIGGTVATGIHVDLYVDIVRQLGLDLLPPKVYDQWQMLARVDEPVMHWLHADVIQLENVAVSFGLRNEGWQAWRTPAGSDVLMPRDFHPVTDARGYHVLNGSDGRPVAIMAPGSRYFDKPGSTELTYGDFTFTDPDEWRRTLPLYTDDELKLLQKRARFYRDNTDYAISGGFFRGGLGTGGPFAGHSLSDWLCILATEEAYAAEILAATADRALENLALYLEAVSDCLDTILVSATDFGTQGGPMFDPAIFRRLHLPNYRRINDYIHARSDIRTIFHSCGSVRAFIPDFIAAGVDILNPVHTNAAGMDPLELKQTFGDRIVFWGGGVETQTVLPFGTPDQCREQVLERLRIFSPGGGFVFSPIHNSQAGVPVDNLKAAVETVFNFRT